MIHQWIDRLIEREGGFNDDPDDNGGPTNMGVTMPALSEYRGYEVSLKEIQDLTWEEVHRLYYDHYWVKPGFAGLILSPVVSEMLLDAGVHHGPAAAVKMLQQAVRVPADGKLGPVSKQTISDTAPIHLASAFMAERVAKLGRIIEDNRSQAKWAAGWMNRMKELIKLIPQA